MPELHLQTHHWQRGWIDCAQITFQGERVRLEYDVDYAAEWLGRKDLLALSVTFPVDLVPKNFLMPGFLTDLIPQGNPLRRILNRYQIPKESDVAAIFSQVPLASPGNVRFREPWQAIERARPTYQHKGFEQAEVVQANTEFIDYMEAHGAPVGGTSGAAGGAPKFLLREDYEGRFHADGYLDDALTRQAWLIKFPFTDSRVSKALVRAEQGIYSVLRRMPLKTSAAIQLEQDILFIPRFDRVRREDGHLHYYGLESFYAAHGIRGHGARLWHEDNLELIDRHCSHPAADKIEYWLRDIVYQALANTDNHGRNTSLIKEPGKIALSPIYDVTAMRFFEGDVIVPLTRWQDGHQTVKEQFHFFLQHHGFEQHLLESRLQELLPFLQNLETLLLDAGVPTEIVSRSASDREQILNELEWLT